jgi:CheY-specific phosphatase CheX
MWHELAGAALAEAARDVLETMCFVAAEEVPGPHPLVGSAPIVSQVEFGGYWTGRCMVEIPEACARLVAGNFTGVLDPDQVDALNVTELVCEFANMVCGSTITRLHCPGIVTLAHPHLIEEWPSLNRSPESFAVERWLDTGDGVVRVGLETQSGMGSAP